MRMDSRAWGGVEGPNFELWDEVLYAVARWMCQQRAHREGGPGDHITKPPADNTPCDWCFDEAYDLVKDGGVGELLEVYGSVAYAAGRGGLPEDTAAKSALRAMVDRVEEVEAATVLLSELDGSGWWRLPLEHDERPPLSEGDTLERSAEA